MSEIPLELGWKDEDEASSAKEAAPHLRRRAVRSTPVRPRRRELEEEKESRLGLN